MTDDDMFNRISMIMNVDQAEIAKIVHSYIERDIGCDYDRMNCPAPPIYIGPVKIKTLKERLEEIKMEPTSVWKIENIDKIWITQDGDEMSFLVKNKDDLTKIILTGDAIKNHNDNFITTLKADMDENEKEFRKQEKKIRKLKKKISELEELKTPTIENFEVEEHSDHPTSDNVNHPSHYETGRFECIDVMEEVFGVEAVKHFCQCNAFKYIYRMNRKNGVEDAEKAVWYLNKYIEHEKEVPVDDIEYLPACEGCKFDDISAECRPCKYCWSGSEFVKKEDQYLCHGGTDNGGKTQVPEGE